jgi:hypothetical protein
LFLVQLSTLNDFFRFPGDSVEPEALNKKALDIVHRVRDKLTGRDFNKEVSAQLQTTGPVGSHSLKIEFFNGSFPRQAIRIRTSNPLMRSQIWESETGTDPIGPGSKTFVQLRIFMMG